MIIKSIFIGRFAAKKDTSVEFCGGINVIRGDNESGKSTLCAFIKFMLFGFADKAERIRFYPPDEASVFGSIVISHEGKDYRIERSHSESGGGKCAIFDPETEKKCFAGMKPSDVFLSGVSADVFMNTVFVGQTSGGKVGGGSLEEAMENIVCSADENSDVDKALKKIDAARKNLLHKSRKGGVISDLTDQRAELFDKLGECMRSNKEMISLKDTVRRAKDEIIRNRNEAGSLSAKISEATKYAGALAAAKRIEKIGLCREKASEKKKRLDILRERYSFDGFIPDREYLDSLKRASEEYRSIVSEKTSVENEISGLEQQASVRDGIAAKLDAIKNAGGQSAVFEKLSDFESGKKKASGTSKLAFTVAVLCAASSLFLFGSALYAGIACLILCAAAIVYGIVSAGKGKRIAGKSEEYVSSIGFADADELREFVFGISGEESALKLREMRLAELKDKLIGLESKADENRRETDRLLALWGRRDTGEAIEKAGEALSELEEAERESAAAESELRILEGAFDGEDEEKYRELINSGVDINTLPDESTTEEYNRRLEALESGYRRLIGEKHEAESRLAVLTATVGDPLLLKSEYDRLTAKINELTVSHDAYVIAYENLSAAAEAMRSNAAPAISKKAGEILSGLTGGRYSDITVSGPGCLNYRADGMTRPIEYMSAGTMDVAYLSLRFALSGMIFTGGAPMIFDESFALQDDRRLEAVCRLLGDRAGDNTQILLFSSHSREADMFSRIGTAFEKIELR